MKGVLNMFQYHGYSVELEYREYQLPEKFPCMALLQGEFSFPASNNGPLTYLHFHNCLEIAICHNGNKELYVEDCHVQFHTGDINVIPPYAIHMSQNKPGPAEDDCEYLYFHPEEILKPFYPNGLPAQLLRYRELNHACILSIEESPTLHRLLSAVLDELRQKRTLYQQTVRGLILAFMVELSRSCCLEHSLSAIIGRRDMAPVLPALNQISKHYAAPMTTKELASLCHLSTAQFCRIFKQLMMQSPADYIRMVKLQKACELLYSTEKSILTIALESGFLSLSAFNRAFLKCYQKCPSKWRHEKCRVQKKNVKYSPFLPVN